MPEIVKLFDLIVRPSHARSWSMPEYGQDEIRILRLGVVAETRVCTPVEGLDILRARFVGKREGETACNKVDLASNEADNLK